MTGDNSLDSLLSVLGSLDQTKLALDTFLNLESKKLHKNITDFEVINPSDYVRAVDTATVKFLLSLCDTGTFVNSRFQSLKSNAMFYFWVVKEIKSFLSKLFLNFSSNNMALKVFWDLLGLVFKHLENTSPELKIDLTSIGRQCLLPHINSLVLLYLGSFLSETRTLLFNDAFKKSDVSSLTESQRRFILQYDESEIHKKGDIDLSFLYMFCVVCSFDHNNLFLIKKNFIQQNIEKYLYTCLTIVLKQSKRLKPDQLECYKTSQLFFKEKIVTRFEKTYPKSKFRQTHSELIGALAR